jgi:hypothetical protein
MVITVTARYQRTRPAVESDVERHMHAVMARRRASR